MAGASVVFILGGKGARFAGNATKLQVATDASGRATAHGLEAVGKGAVRIQVQASFQGETVTATVTETNFATAADAAQAGRSAASSQSGTNGAAQGAGEASHHVGLIAVGGAAAAGGIIAAKQLGKCDIDGLEAAARAYFVAVDDNYVQCVSVNRGAPSACAPQLAAANAAALRFIDVNTSYCSCAGGVPGLTTAYTDNYTHQIDGSRGDPRVRVPWCD